MTMTLTSDNEFKFHVSLTLFHFVFSFSTEQGLYKCKLQCYILITIFLIVEKSGTY